MAFDLPLHCFCGHVQGIAQEISPGVGFRLICYCGDCQAFARFLDRLDVLDDAGGTDIFQVAAARVTLTAGADAVRCVTFSGKVLRWYADCCRTPVANTAAGHRFPVVALIHAFMARDGDGRLRDECLGPPSCRIYESSAAGSLPPDAPPPPSPCLLAVRALRIFGWWTVGFGRPNAFFDHRTGMPLAMPRVFTPAERASYKTR